MNALGASAVYIPHEDVYTALQTGTIDASGTSAYMYEAQKYYEVCPYFVLPYIGHPISNEVMLTMDVRNELPEDLKELLSMSVRWLSYERERAGLIDDAQMLARAEAEYGTTISTLSDADLKVITTEAMIILDDIGAMSDRCAKMVKIIKDYNRMMGYID